MTRGRFVLITDKQVLGSMEFNGDMYYEVGNGRTFGHGKEASFLIDFIYDREDLQNTCVEFAKKNFPHLAEEYQPEDFTDIWGDVDMSDKLAKADVLNFKKNNYIDEWFSDYLYIKNMSGKDFQIVLEDGSKFVLLDNGICSVYFGSEVDKSNPINAEIVKALGLGGSVFENREYLLTSKIF